MITKLKISGFKSFQNFEIEFSPFTMIAGVNASGKSNLFDALSLLSRLAEVDLKTAFGAQRGDASELFTQYGKELFADEMSFDIELLVNKTVRDKWGGQAELKYTRLRYLLIIEQRKDERGYDSLFVKDEKLEIIKQSDDEWVKKHIPFENLEFRRPKISGPRGKPYIYKTTVNGVPAFKIPQDGKQGGKETPANAVGQTVLSGVNSVDFPHVFAAREDLRTWNFMQLNPEFMSQPIRKNDYNGEVISRTGHNLAGALHRIQREDDYAKVEISRELNRFLPEFVKAESDDKDDDGTTMTKYIIKLQGADQREFTSRVLSEGTLRLLALITLQHDDQHQGLLCFEEPENGIHPQNISSALELLVSLSADFGDNESPLRQVIVNTHSPVLLGYAKRFHANIW